MVVTVTIAAVGCEFPVAQPYAAYSCALSDRSCFGIIPEERRCHAVRLRLPYSRPSLCRERPAPSRAAGFAVAHRLDVAIPVAINAGVSLTGNSFGGARMGLSGEF